MGIITKQGDITQIDCDAIINPANSFGYMGGGVAGAIKRVGGKEIESEAVNKAPIVVGKAIATTAGDLPYEYVIHAPTMKRPAMRTSV
ncbi:MAG: macro domain-containing protein, partial [Candidatus Thermoplasmatota archaeon]|nr:macro domain-containing protein [Candidatus Thermoplasmatota archaeon]